MYYLLKIQAFIIEGSAFILAILIAITHALEAAVPVNVARRGLSKGQIRPRTYGIPIKSSSNLTTRRGHTNTPRLSKRRKTQRLILRQQLKHTDRRPRCDTTPHVWPSECWAEDSLSLQLSVPQLPCQTVQATIRYELTVRSNDHYKRIWCLYKSRPKRQLEEGRLL